LRIDFKQIYVKNISTNMVNFMKKSIKQSKKGSKVKT
jgi:hypothetical protein